MNHMRLCGFAFGALIGFGLTNACMVSDTYTIRYYQLDEGQRVKRVVLAASFAPGVGETIEPAVLEMYQGVVREFVSHHHEYILLDARILPRDVFAANLPGATAIPRRLRSPRRSRASAPRITTAARRTAYCSIIFINWNARADRPLCAWKRV